MAEGMACVWFFRLLIRSSIKQKNWEKIPWLENNKSWKWGIFRFCGRLRVFAGICKIFAGVFAGHFCRKNNVIVVFVVSAFHCAFRIHLRWRQPTELRGALQVLCIIYLYLPEADILLYRHSRPKKCKMDANRLKQRECAILVKIFVCTKDLAT